MEPDTFGAQLGLFYSSKYLTGSTIDVPALMGEHFGEEVDVTAIPIPNDAPAEIPRYKMRLGSLVFNLSNIRADMVSEDGNFTDEQIQNFIATVTAFGAEINRVGYVLKKRYVKINTDFLESNLNISSTRFGEELGNISEAMWRINKKRTLGAAGSCNNISSLSLEKDGNDTNAILIRDVNTEQETPLQLSTANGIETVVNLLKEEALRNDNILV